MFRKAEIAHWSDADLVELWRERVAMVCPWEPDEGQTKEEESKVKQAGYLAARELMLWAGPGRVLPIEIMEGARKFRFRTQELFQ